VGVRDRVLKLVTARIPQLRSAAIRYYQRRSLKGGWHDQHPFDRTHGVETSGMIPGFLLKSGSTAYGAAQPSILGRAITAIPNPGQCHFIDLGCGKGRPLFVAAAARFMNVTGVEFSPTLAQVARRNAAIFMARNLGCTPIAVITGDMLEYRLPPEPSVLFIYNPFEGALVSRLIRNIEASLRDKPRDLYVIYYNPVYAEFFDASAFLERRFAAQIRYDASEIGFGPDLSDAVVIWQNRGNPHPRPMGNPTAPVTVVTPRWRAEVAQ
jgi:SAM-dependent methyltransferase